MKGRGKAATSMQVFAHRVLRVLLRISLEGRVQPVHQLVRKGLQVES